MAGLLLLLLMMIRPLGAFELKGRKVVKVFLIAEKKQARILNYFPLVTLKGPEGRSANPPHPPGLIGQRKRRDGRVDSY